MRITLAGTSTYGLTFEDGFTTDVTVETGNMLRLFDVVSANGWDTEHGMVTHIRYP